MPTVPRPAATILTPMSNAAPVQQAGDGLPPPGPVRHLGQRRLQALVRAQAHLGHGAAVLPPPCGEVPGRVEHLAPNCESIGRQADHLQPKLLRRLVQERVVPPVVDLVETHGQQRGTLRSDQQSQVAAGDPQLSRALVEQDH